MVRIYLLLLAMPLAAQDLTKEKAAALSSMVAAQVMKHSAPISEPAVRAYVEALGEKLQSHIPGGPARPWTFSLLNLDSYPLNSPIVLPDGRIFVPVSLILASQEEAEFAGMLIHAICHRQRESQPENDRETVEIMRRAGYDPAAFARYVSRQRSADPQPTASAVADPEFAGIQALLRPPAKPRTPPTLFNK